VLSHNTEVELLALLLLVEVVDGEMAMALELLEPPLVLLVVVMEAVMVVELLALLLLVVPVVTEAVMALALLLLLAVLPWHPAVPNPNMVLTMDNKAAVSQL